MTPQGTGDAMEHWEAEWLEHKGEPYPAEAQSRITTLEGEVAKLERERNHFRDQQVELAMQVNEAWDEAREAAAHICETLGVLGGEEKNPYACWYIHAKNLSLAIRALKRG